jgi:hypothetical protein
MQKLHLVAAAILVGGIGTAAAQTTTSQTTTTVVPDAPAVVVSPPVVMSPPAGTLSTSQTRKVIRPDGSSYERRSTTYRNTDGLASDSVTRVTPAPVIAPQSTTTTTTRTITQRP